MSGSYRRWFPQSETKKLLKKWRGHFQITEVHQVGRFYRLSTVRAAHYENIKPHNDHRKTGAFQLILHEDD